MPKKLFPIKTKKGEHPYWILRIRISLSTKCQQYDNYDFLDQVCLESVFLIWNIKWTVPLILHIIITLGTEF